MNTTKSDRFSKLLLGLVLLVVLPIAIPSCYLPHRAAVARKEAIHARGEDRLASAWHHSALAYSEVTVQGPKAAIRLLADAVELEAAMKQWAQTNRVADWEPATYADIAPYLDGNSRVRALGGKDSEGGTWGPFTVGQVIKPCQATQDKFSKEVQPSYWNSR